MDNEHPVLEINQTLITALAIAASVLVIVLYYENRQMRQQLYGHQPCSCDEQVAPIQTTQRVYDQGPIDHSPQPDVMPNNQKPPEVVVD